MVLERLVSMKSSNLKTWGCTLSHTKPSKQKCPELVLPRDFLQPFQIIPMCKEESRILKVFYHHLIISLTAWVTAYSTDKFPNLYLCPSPCECMNTNTVWYWVWHFPALCTFQIITHCTVHCFNTTADTGDAHLDSFLISTCYQWVNEQTFIGRLHIGCI